MFTFFSCKQFMRFLSCCALLMLSFSAMATVVISPGPPPVTKLVTTATRVGGKWVTKVDPLGVYSFNLNFSFDPNKLQIDTSGGYLNSGITFLNFYIPDSVQIISSGLINITGHLADGYVPSTDPVNMFEIAFTALPEVSGSTTLTAFADPATGAMQLVNTADPLVYIPVAAADILPGSVTIHLPLPQSGMLAFFSMGLAGLLGYWFRAKSDKRAVI